MSRFACVAVAAVIVVALSSAARADLVITINKSSQSMSVAVDGQHRYTWAVSTGIYGTQSGSFRPQSLSRW